MKSLKYGQKNKGKKKMAQPQKCVVKPFLASLRGFEPRTFRLGDAPGTPFGLKNRGKKSLEIIDIKGFESF